MPTLREIRRRIGSVAKTREITAAMKTVSAIKVRNAETALLQMRPYASLLTESISRLSACEDPAVHPLLADRGNEKAILVVITSDRGLCGAFNANVIRRAVRYQEDHRIRFGAYARMICVGKRGYDYFRKRGYDILEAHLGFFKGIDYDNARAIGQTAAKAFLALDVDQVDFLYHYYFSAGRQEVQVRTVLPLRVCDMVPPAAIVQGTTEEAALQTVADYIYEPNRGVILNEILPLYVNYQVWRVLQESISSEHGARMMAMDAATENCDELLDTLRLVYNKARQASITKELTEVVSAAESVK